MITPLLVMIAANDTNVLVVEAEHVVDVQNANSECREYSFISCSMNNASVRFLSGCTIRI